jgi:hypothetical protein
MDTDVYQCAYCGRAAEPGRTARNPLPSITARLNFYSLNPLGLGNYEVRHFPLSLQPRASWFTLLYWQQLLEDAKPVPWAPAILHYEIDLREPVTV